MFVEIVIFNNVWHCSNSILTVKLFTKWEGHFCKLFLDITGW